jgi:hypothetical protein
MIKNKYLYLLLILTLRKHIFILGFLIINNEISITKHWNTLYVIVFVDINNNNYS